MLAHAYNADRSDWLEFRAAEARLVFIGVSNVPFFEKTTVQTIAVTSLKGGVGKTTTTHALGVLLSEGRRVLLVDADPQASLTHACGVPASAGRSLAQVLGTTSGGMALKDAIFPLSQSLAIVPAHRSLGSAELSLVLRAERESILKQALTTVATRYRLPDLFKRHERRARDLVLIDTPPNLGLLTTNALVAADGVLIPTIPEALGWESLQLLLERIDQVRRTLNRNLDVIGILPCFYDDRLIHHRAVLETMRAAGIRVLDVKVGRSIRVAEAAEHRQSVVTYAPENRRSLEYQVLAQVIDGWLRDR